MNIPTACDVAEGLLCVLLDGQDIENNTISFYKYLGQQLKHAFYA